MRVAIPHHEGEVAPCFEYSAHFTIFSVTRNKVVTQTDFTLKSQKELDRVRLLRDQEVTVLICSGIQDAFEGLLRGLGHSGPFLGVRDSRAKCLAFFLRTSWSRARLGPEHREERPHGTRKPGSPIHEKEKQIQLLR